MGFGVFQSEDEEMIIWTSANRKLEFSDFKMNPPEISDSLAVSTCGIKYNYFKYDDYFEVQVIAVFYPKKSWIRVKEDKVLKHEQGHFDICEMTARRIRKDFIYYNHKVSKESVDDFVELIMYNRKQEHNENQKIYETSRESIELQEYLSKMIDDELEKLSDFKSKTVKVYYLNNKKR